jgi:hypothetical protein
MPLRMTACVIITLAGLVGTPTLTFARSPAPPYVPLQKAIAETHPDLVPCAHRHERAQRPASSELAICG